ncbi:MAG: 2-C-methyl-D-erythritol 4-phosphate cytidylyltransferase [Candidatus Abyssubacteria bacterium]
MRVAAIIPAAGRGVRMRSARSKILSPLLGKPLILWAIDPFLRLDSASEILIAVSAEDADAVGACVRGRRTAVRLIRGGETRQESVANCLREARHDCDMVAVHDAARPLLTDQLLGGVLAEAAEHGAAIAAVPCKDTVKQCNEEGFVERTLDRSRLWLVQTPQCFRRELLVEAYEKALSGGVTATDDSALVERLGVAVRVVFGSYENIKVTTPEDIPVCEEILRRRQT